MPRPVRPRSWRRQSAERPHAPDARANRRTVHVPRGDPATRPAGPPPAPATTHARARRLGRAARHAAEAATRAALGLGDLAATPNARQRVTRAGRPAARTA